MTAPSTPPSPTPPSPTQRSRRLSTRQRVVITVAALAVIAAGTGITLGLTRHGGDTQADTTRTAAKASGVDTSAQQSGRVRISEVPAAVAALKGSGFSPVHKGELTVATTGGSAPLSFTADDGSTLIGSEVDVAQLIADGLGLKLRVEATSWADWPLGAQSGKYDLVLSNVGVTEERKDLFDFATYRHGLHSFLVRKDSDLSKLSSPADIAGLKIVVGSGTNQEKILQAWNKINEKAGRKPATLVYYDDAAASLLALRSGRVDASLGPNPSQIYQAQISDDLKVVGRINAGWPDNSDVGAVTKKGDGLIHPVQLVLTSAQTSGKLTESLKRWGLQGEEVATIQVNPKGLPRETK